MAETFEVLAERIGDDDEARDYRLAAAERFIAARDTKRARATLDELLKANPKDGEKRRPSSLSPMCTADFVGSMMRFQRSRTLLQSIR